MQFSGGKEKKKGVVDDSFMPLFGQYGGNRIEELLTKRKLQFIGLNSFCLYNLWVWSSVFMIQGPSIVDFVDWLRSG